jgi:hypothetical protein
MTIKLHKGSSITEFIEEFQGALDKSCCIGTYNDRPLSFLQGLLDVALPKFFPRLVV